MSGKIFDASANIYQDQAKVLFDYYKQAAEKLSAKKKSMKRKLRFARECCTT
jgi:tetrahydromethanopterin S-methyltransferase subunit H